MDETFEVALVGRLKHGAILRGLQANGWSQSDLARALGSNQTQIGLLINMKRAPSKRWLTPARERVLLDLTGQLPDELWPDWSRSKAWLGKDKRLTALAKAPVARLISAAANGLLSAPEAPDVCAMQGEIRGKIVEQLKTLAPREQKILTLRFGLDGEGEHTLEEVALREGVSRECIRQIEARALRKLRHPSRSKHLKGFLDLADIGQPDAPDRAQVATIQADCHTTDGTSADMERRRRLVDEWLGRPSTPIEE